MTVAKSGDIANVREALVAEKVQRELAAQAKLLGLFEDYSSLAGAGASEVKVPRSDSFTVADRDNATPAAASAMNLTFSFDKIEFNKSKYVYYIIPGDIELEAKPSYELTAAGRAASAHGRNIDVEFIDALWTGAKIANYVEFDTGTSDIEQTLLDMIQIADEANMPDDGNRFLLVKPQERKELLKVANFVQADKYGDRTPLVSGELGQAYGVRIVVINQDGVTNHATEGTVFENGKMMLVHRESAGIAFHRQPTHDMDKAIEYGAGSMKHTWDVKYGCSDLQDGNLIVRAWNKVP
jgi:N4-gp56 family major capsid protein